MSQQYNKPNIIPLSTVMNANLSSVPIQLQNSLFYAIQIVFTGTPTGTFELEVSCDNSANMTASGKSPYTPTNWTVLAGTSQAVSVAGSVFWNETFAGYSFVRAIYTDGSSGSSTAIITSATVNVKA